MFCMFERNPRLAYITLSLKNEDLEPIYDKVPFSMCPLSAIKGPPPAVVSLLYELGARGLLR